MTYYSAQGLAVIMEQMAEIFASYEDIVGSPLPSDQMRIVDVMREKLLHHDNTISPDKRLILVRASILAGVLAFIDLHEAGGAA